MTHRLLSNAAHFLARLPSRALRLGLCAVVPAVLATGAVAQAPATQPLTYGLADSVMEEPYRLGLEKRTVEIQQGDSLAALINRYGIPYAEAHEAGTLLDANMAPGDFRPGREIVLLLQHRGPVTVFAGLEFQPNPDVIKRVVREDDGPFRFEEIPTVLDIRTAAAAGTIDSSLYLAANAAGVPDRVLVDLIRTYSHTVDFQRELRDGDQFALFYERAYFADGTFARSGDVLYAELTLSGESLPVFRFERDDGTVDYFDREGESARRQLLATPLDGFRISSGFGARRHPILGYTRMHRGIDFAAPTGTPIYAAGSGVIEFYGRNSGFGNYVRIRHNSRYKTAYAHLSRFADGLSVGSRVQQGQVIGYVGSTGMSTGPHLHYEVHVDGTQVNPLDLDLPTAENLEGTELARFVEERDRIIAAFAQTVPTLPGQAADAAPMPSAETADTADATPLPAEAEDRVRGDNVAAGAAPPTGG